MTSLDDLRLHDPAIDEAAVRHDRLARVRRQLRRAGLPAIVIVDSINLRYATGSRNMQVWTLHNFCRYAFVPAEGPVVLFDLPSAAHLNRGLETIDEVRPSLAWDYMMVGPRGEEMARRWAAELADLLRRQRRRQTPPRDRPGRPSGRAGPGGRRGRSRSTASRSWNVPGPIKSREEIRALTLSLRACEESVAAMRAAAPPGQRESEAWPTLLRASVARGGEYPGNAAAEHGPAHQSLVPGSQRPGHAGRRPDRLRHRPDRADGVLQRHLAHLGGRRGDARATSSAGSTTWRGGSSSTTSHCCGRAWASPSTASAPFNCPSPISPTATPTWRTAAASASSIR